MVASGEICAHVKSRNEDFDSSGGRIELQEDLPDHRPVIECGECFVDTLQGKRSIDPNPEAPV
jgi:hypothetical protein